MKKLLFVLPNFETGGTVTSLINILSLLDKDRFEPYVYAITGYGSLKEEIAKRATIIGDSQEGAINNKSWRSRLFYSAKRFFKILQSLGIDLSEAFLKREVSKLQKGNYDVVMAFQEGTATKMVSYFNGIKKTAWVRSMYSRYLELNGRAPEIEMYDKYDTIVSVSDAACDDFISCCPQLEKKVVRVYDILNAERIIGLSSATIQDFTHECFTMISIGRLDPVKRFSMIPEIAKELKGKGYKFKWLIIGGAPETNKQEEVHIKELIQKNKVEENVIMLGRKTNPYPYLRQSDLLVCLSSSETFNYTLTEAKILGVPIVTTDYACAKESVENNKEGVITSIDNIEKIIETLMTDKNLYDEIKDRLSIYQYNNSSILEDLSNRIFSNDVK